MLTNVNDFNKSPILNFIICGLWSIYMYREPYRTKINFYKNIYFLKFEIFFSKVEKNCHIKMQ